MKRNTRNAPAPQTLADRIEAAGYGTTIGRTAADDAACVGNAIYSAAVWSGTAALDPEAVTDEVRAKFARDLAGVAKRVGQALRTQAGRDFLSRRDLDAIHALRRTFLPRG